MKIAKLLHSFARTFQTPDPTEDRWYTPLIAPANTAGQHVSASTAERIAAVYACKTAISESLAMLPAVLYRELEGNKKDTQPDHPLFELLRHAPNSLMDSFTFHEVLATQLLDFGNAYCFIIRNRAKEVIELIPLDPERMRVELKNNNQVVYKYTEPAGGAREMSSEQVFHVRYRSKDGIIGRSPIQVAAQSIGFSLALQEFGNSMFENGAFPSGLIKSPFAFKDDEARHRFMSVFKSYMGAKNAGKWALLEQGVEYVPLQMTNKDAQFLEAKQFGVIEIARIYRVPPHMIQELKDGASYASIEQQGINYVQHTIQPWVVRLERAIKRQLLNNDNEKELYLRYNISSLIRGDLQSRTNSVVQQLQYGLRTINEARELLDQPARDEPIADQLLLSHNLVPSNNDGQVTPIVATPPKKQEPEQPEQPVQQKSLEHFRPLVLDAFRRLNYQEEQAGKKEKKKGTVLKWAEQFYDEHKARLANTLSPIACAALSGDAVRSVVIELFVKDWFNERADWLLASVYPWEQDDAESKADLFLKYIKEEGQRWTLKDQQSM